ncbi:hypothetical protein Cgig2_013367 [Carnegiea gigantea]|uniref:Aminotransferase-like plant mobile domain-containing protein n=1 Tax=Carnegiea gigantea TaxID=171969 RepID=A0A9Q1K7H9_9CARY|nr:hypothetical protein Cgig2_013367 [Carnegiea gigantea]
MASGVGYYLPTAILTSIYRGLNEISRSSHPSRGWGYFPTHFLYAWLAKNFDLYELVGEASSSPGMVKFNGIGQAKSFQLEEARELIASGRGFRWHSSINRLKETLVDDGKLSRADFAYFVSIRSGFLSYHCEHNFVMEHYCPDRFIHTPVIHRSDLFDTNTSKDEGKLGSKPKLKIVRSGKPLEPSVPPMGDGSSRVKIPGIDIVIPAKPIPAIPIQNIVPLPQDEITIRVCEPTTKKVIELLPEGAENIMDIFNSEPNPTECRVLFFSSKHDFFANVYLTGADVTPLKSKDEGFIKQACDLKDLQQSYSGRTSVEEHDTCRMEVQGKLDEASRGLNTEGAHYEAKMAELKHVESRRQELLKELQLLEEQ